MGPLLQPIVWNTITGIVWRSKETDADIMGGKLTFYISKQNIFFLMKCENKSSKYIYCGIDAVVYKPACFWLSFLGLFELAEILLCFGAFP